MTAMSKPAKGRSKHKKNTKPSPQGVSPICPVGKDYCKKPGRWYQIYTKFCDNCGEEVHENCVEELDVPHKFKGDDPGFYCFKCIDILPRSLYPRMPSNGISRNIPSHCEDGSLPFEQYMAERKKMISQEKAKKKKTRLSYSYPTRALVTRNLRSHR